MGEGGLMPVFLSLFIYFGPNPNWVYVKNSLKNTCLVQFNKKNQFSYIDF